MTARIYDLATARADKERRRRGVDPFGVLGFWTGYASAVLELQVAALSLLFDPVVRR